MTSLFTPQNETLARARCLKRKNSTQGKYTWENLGKVRRAFLAYADGANENALNRGSHCVLRDHESLIGLWLENRFRQHGLNPSLFIPLKECAPGTVRESIDTVAKAMPNGKPLLR